MIVVDLIETPMPELWSQVTEYIKHSDDKLKDNYISIDFNQFLSFPCVIENDKIICFSGLQYDISKWGRNIARCSSRLWIHPEYRISSLSNFSGGNAFLNTTYCMPIQIQKAKSKNISALFISRKDKIKGFQRYLDLIKINCNVEFKINEHRYNVCGNTPTVIDSCEQYVATHFLSPSGKDAWISSMINYLIIKD